MQEYSQYSERLGYLATRILDLKLDNSAFGDEIENALNGEPSRELRRLVSIQAQRESGAFFTPPDLAEAAIAPIRDSIDDQSVVADIACGVGDLLLACVDYVDSPYTLSGLIAKWSRQLVGCEIHSEFVSVAKLRLFFHAFRLCSDVDLDLEGPLFPNIKQVDAFSNLDAVANASHLVINPPFNQVPIPEHHRWATGKVNSAAIFLDYCVTNAKPGTKIAAILPDVLRSGTRYRKWRKHIEGLSSDQHIEVYGRFSRWADVHVFLLNLTVAPETQDESSMRWTGIDTNTEIAMADRFTISVGSVVDYRDPEEGDLFSFIKPRQLPAWETVNEIKSKRRFKGTVFQPPFVAVRRTSRQEDQYRAVATVVDTSEPVAVENHLIVFSPKSGNIDDCDELLAILRSDETNDWLNRRIQCRHLTVTALRQLPWQQK